MGKKLPRTGITKAMINEAMFRYYVEGNRPEQLLYDITHKKKNPKKIIKGYDDPNIYKFLYARGPSDYDLEGFDDGSLSTLNSVLSKSQFKELEDEVKAIRQARAKKSIATRQAKKKPALKKLSAKAKAILKEFENFKKEYLRV